MGYCVNMDMLTETTVLSFNLVLVDIQNITLVGLKIRVLVILFHIGNAVETIQISSWSRIQVNSAYPVITIPIKGLN